MKKLLIIGLAIALLGFNTIFGAGVEDLVKQGEELYKIAANGDKESVEKAEEILTEALKIEPENTSALILLGGVYTLKGRDSKMPWNKMKWVKNGCRLMDKAVKLDSTNLSLRIERAMNNKNLPSFFGRKEIIKKDFEFLLSRMQYAHFPISVQQMIYLNAGKMYADNSNIEKAKELWEKTIHLEKEGKKGKEGKFAKEAQKQLDKLQ